MDSKTVEAFFESYGAAVQSSDIDRIVSHYAEPYTAFAMGQTIHFPDRKAAKAAAAPHIAKLRAWGLSNARAIDVKFDTISEGFALCNTVWQVRPLEGESWHMKLVYGLRMHPEGLLAELAIGDGEAINMSQRYPDFFKS